MSQPPSLPQRLRAAVKGWMVGTSSPWYLGDTTGGALGLVYNPHSLDYRKEAGPADANAIVMACVHWVTTTWPEAPARVRKAQGDQLVAVPDHALLHLLDIPNEYYTGLDLWAATLTDYNIGGNGYWIAPLNSAGRPVELWYEPSFSIRCVGTPQKFIDHWEIYRDGAWLRLNPRENLVIHFRNGIDPRNPRYGISRLVAAYRELYTDAAAADWTATLLRNTGIPGVIIAPEGNDEITEPAQVKQDYMNKFTGDRRGEPLVMTRPTKVFKLDFSPAEMDLTATRRMPEERITALMGIPASVAGLGAGLDRNTFSNSATEDDKAWHNNIIPSHKRFAATLELRLLPLLGNPATEQVDFDTSQVKALQDDANDLYTRMATGYDSGYVLRSEARTLVGLPPAADGSDDVYKASAPVPPALPAPDTTKARRAARRKAAPPPDATERRFRRDVQGVLDTVYRQALAEVPDGKALAGRRNGHTEG